MFIKRILSLSLLTLTAVSGVASGALAQTDIFVRGSGKLFPIAAPRLCASGFDTTAASDIPRTIGKDLDVSGFFEVLSPSGYIESAGKCGAQESTVYSDWSTIRAEGVVKGVVEPAGDQIRVKLYLHDVNKQQVVLGKEYTGDASQLPKIAHKFANEIMKYFTGELGVFDTEIAYTSKVGRFKELFVMDMNGDNIRQLTNDHSLTVGAAWSPDGQRLAFTSYRSRQPDLFTMNVATRAVSRVTGNSILELSPKFTQSGQTLITSVSDGNDTHIVEMSPQGQILRKITSANRAIDVSADYSPDYSQIAFCSDRAGGPQIYVMGADGSNPKRISFASSNYCTSPSWSPKGDLIAYVCRSDGGFQMYTAKPDGSNAVQLTSSGDNEDPTFSPDGRYITFSTTQGRGGTSTIGLMRSDGSNYHKLSNGRFGDSEPAWSPRVP